MKERSGLVLLCETIILTMAMIYSIWHNKVDFEPTEISETIIATHTAYALPTRRTT
jgi:hypothetical protein